MPSNARLRIQALLKHLFAGPHLPNEDETRVASVLHRALILLILLQALAFLVLPISDHPLLTTSILVAFITGSLLGLYQLKRGSIQRAAALFCAVGWSITTLMSLFSGGMSSPVIFAYIGIITIAGLVFSRHTATIVTAICAASSLVLVAISVQGWLPPSVLIVDWLMYLVVHQLLFVWLAYLFFLTKSSADEALVQVRAQEHELQRQTNDLLRLNSELQKEIGERKRALAAMHESEKRFRTAVEYLPDMFAIYDADGKATFANAILLKALNLTWNEIKAGTVEDSLPPSIKEVYQPLLLEAAQTGQAVISERTILSANEQENHLVFNYIPLHNEDGNLYEIIGIIKDVTVQRQTERVLEDQKELLSLRVQERTAELSRANAQLIDAMRAKDEFLATINHELRTPLTSVILGTQMLQSAVHGTPSSEQQQFLDMIERNSQNLLTLINDILYFSKLEAGQFEPRLTAIDVPQLCQEIVELARALAQEKELDLQLDIQMAEQVLYADERSLRQILGNLLNNAIKFTHENGEVGLRVKTGMGHQSMSFEIWDTGIGIAPDDMERVFQPFVQIDSGLSRQYEGSGLGLSLIRRLTDLHGGNISLVSEVEKGSTFTVTLPLSRPSTQAEAAEAIIRHQPEHQSEHGAADILHNSPPIQPQIQLFNEVQETTSGPPSSSTDTEHAYRVLVAEDTEHTLKTLSIFLTYRGCQVTMARNGVEAIERTFEDLPEIILIDIEMPIMGGLEAIARIRTEEAGKKIPIIALTALTMPGDREKCLQAGADLYITKPVNMHELFNEMKQIIADKQRT